MAMFSPQHRALVAAAMASFWITQGSANSTCGNDAWDVINANKDNPTALHSIFSDPWVSSPQFRGTMSILQSCLLTLVACIYTALHLNVPVRKGWYHILVTKAKWVIMALIAPEIVLYMAADQLTQAVRLKKKLRTLQEKSTVVRKDFEFTLKYCFFIVMGGLRIPSDLVHDMLSVDDADYNHRSAIKRALVDAKATITLTPQGVIELANRDHWIYIPVSKINDKSKADIVQKILVLCQVTWMATQCITRKIYGLPLTLLEIHTMVHVVCAVGLYAFWFKKPLDIQEPEIVSNEEWLDVLALMIQKSFHTNNSNYLVYSTDEAARDKYSQFRASRGDGAPTVSFPLWYPSDQPSRGEMPPTRLRRLSHMLTLAMAEDSKPLPVSRASGPIYKVSDILKCSWLDNTRDNVCLSLSSSNLSFSYTISGFELDDVVMFITEAPGLCALSLLLPIIYGGIHLTAWNFEFPTNIELLLWKAACFDIGLTLVGVAVIAFLVAIIGFLLSILVDKVGLDTYLIDPFDIADYLFRGFLGISMVAYACSRMFIVVESFVSLRHVPIGVYWTPAWLQMIPHF